MYMDTNARTSYQFCHELPCAEATISLARRLAPFLRLGDVVALKGELGSGKTTFARALICELVGVDLEVPSPTYTLAQSYMARSFEIWHFDLYRIKSADELLKLELAEMQRNCLLLIEWPDRLGPGFMSDRLEIIFKYLGDNEARGVEFVGLNSWEERLRELKYNDS